MNVTLTDTEIHSLQKQVFLFLETEPSVTNRKLRNLTGIGYDQAIYFFNSMLKSGKLVRVGKASATKYVLSDP
jgi:predicted HTH transcriptional regulator